MNLVAARLSRKHNMRFVLEQTPAESTAFRFAKLDLEHFPKEAEKVVKGNLKDNSVYYTNSTYLNVSHPVNPIDRVKMEGKFHDMIEAGALTHIWIADSHPTPESIANFVTKTFRQTRNAQIAFSPEFTTCNLCSRVYRGLMDVCPHCVGKKVSGIERIK